MNRILHVDPRWTQKAGHRPDEYEDAFAASAPGRWPHRIAVADGATETAFAGAWARHLATAFAAHATAEAPAPDALLASWQAAFRPPAPAGNVPWYVTAKAEEGAAATLLGLSLAADGSWWALAVGDCCLLHHAQARNAPASWWPLSHPDQFNHRPALFHSSPDHPPPTPAMRRGTWHPGDAFILATDAAAAWLMSRPDAGRPTPPTDADFLANIHAARQAGTLRNDDVTAVWVTTDGGAS